MPKWPADSVERRPIERLTPYLGKTRKHPDAQIRQVADSIVQWGWTIPVPAGDDGGLTDRVGPGLRRPEPARGCLREGDEDGLTVDRRPASGLAQRQAEHGPKGQCRVIAMAG